ncbi:hypothetical protein LPJ81_002232 [Coemansia sp. IMI 209127]|nr:hypothetical protein LPJ81_002232 [Coemansia sp. IMI 209127]
MHASRASSFSQQHSGHLPQPHDKTQRNAQDAQGGDGTEHPDKASRVNSMSTNVRTPPDNTAVCRRASAINFSLGPSIADPALVDDSHWLVDAHNTPTVPGTKIHFALSDEDRPGSYANRRRGSIHRVHNSADGNGLSSGGSSTASSSTATSPVFPRYAHRNRLLATAHHRYYYRPHSMACNLLSRLKRNNTTKTITQNDLLAGTESAIHDLRRSETYSRNLPLLHTGLSEYEGIEWLNASDPSLSLRHTYYSQLTMSPESTALDFAENATGRYKEEEEHQGSQCQSRCSDATSDSHQLVHFTGSVHDFDDDTDVASKIVPKVNTVGTQFAYLPPRSAKLAITN